MIPIAALTIKMNMMKVKIIKNIVGPLGSFKKGKVYEVDDSVATELLNCGFAVAIETKVEKETATSKTKRTTRKTKATK